MKDNRKVDSFFDYMYKTIKDHGFSKTSIAQRAGLSRDYVFKILNPNSGKRIIDRDYLIAMCIAAKMTYRETQHALELYPFPVLDDADERSGLIMYALRHSLSLDDLNDFLATRGFPMIRTSPEMEKATIGPVRSTRFGEQDVTSRHDEELIAAVIRRMHMNNKKNIEVWREGCAGNYGMYAEMKFTDKGGVTSVKAEKFSVKQDGAKNAKAMQFIYPMALEMGTVKKVTF